MRFLFLVFLFALTARAEFPVTENRALAPTLGDSRDARVVATDEGFLAFWRTTTTYGMEGFAQIARFSRDGELERRNTAWLLPASFQWYDAASNGDQVLLAGVMTGEFERRLTLARFTSAGDYVGSTLLPISQPVAPVLASDGEDFLVTFTLSQTKQAVAIPVSADGVAGEPIVLGAWDPGSQWTSAAAINGTYFVAWGAPGGHVLSRLSDSRAEATVPLAPPFEISQVRIESSGDRILVVVTPLRANEPTMRAAIFDAGLAQLTGWFPLGDATAMPRVSATDDGWMVSAAGWERALMIPVARDGSVGPVAGVPMPGISSVLIDAAARGDRAALVWTTPTSDAIDPDYRFNAARIAIFDDAGTPVRAPATISLGPAPQIHPSAAHAGPVRLVAWVERTLEERFVVRARAFDTQGMPLGGAVTMPAGEGDQKNPVVASDGSSFFVAWSEATDAVGAIKASRLDASGRLLDDDPIEVFADSSYHSSKPGIDWSGSAWVVATSSAEQIVAKRVSPGGVVLDTAPRAISDAGSHYEPIVACDGESTCFIAWHGPSDPFECRITCAPPDPSIVGKRIDQDLSPLDAMPIRLSGQYEPVSDLDASWSDAQDAWLIAWSPTTAGRIARNGRLLDAARQPLLYARGDVSILPERNGWRLAWSASTVWYSRSGLFHGWSATGSLRDVETRYPLTRSIEHERHPDLVGEHRPLAFFQRESQISAGSPGVFGQFLDEVTEPIATTLALSATPISGRQVRLAWTSDVVGVTGFTIYRLVRRWETAARIGPEARAYDVPHARAFRVVATTPSGPVESNLVEVPAQRQRTVVR